MNLLKTSLQIILIAVFQLIVIYFFLNNESLKQYIHEKAFLTAGFLFFSMLVVHMMNFLAFKFKPETRGGIFMIALTFRMLLGLSFVLVLVYFGLDNRIIFAFNFIIMYLAYMVFEMKTIIANLRAISSDNS